MASAEASTKIGKARSPRRRSRARTWATMLGRPSLALAGEGVAGDEELGDRRGTDRPRGGRVAGCERVVRHRHRCQRSGVLQRGDQGQRRLGALVAGSRRRRAVRRSRRRRSGSHITAPASLAPRNQPTRQLDTIAPGRVAGDGVGAGAGVGHGRHLDRLLVEHRWSVVRSGAADGGGRQVPVEGLAVEQPPQQRRGRRRRPRAGRGATRRRGGPRPGRRWRR